MRRRGGFLSSHRFLNSPEFAIAPRKPLIKQKRGRPLRQPAAWRVVSVVLKSLDCSVPLRSIFP